MPTHIGPTFHEEPPNLFRVLVALRSTANLFHNLCLGAIDLDVGRCRAVSRIVGVRGADIRDFEHHVREPVFPPKGDTNVLHAVA